MNLLTLVQKFCRRTNIPVPVTVYGSTDAQILQAMAILEEEVNDLASRHTWQGLQHEATHTTIAAEDQGNINTLDPGFRFIRNNTIWDYTDRLPVLGPLNGQQWQALKAILSTGPRYQFRFRGDHLIVNPVPVAGHTWKFEYESKYAILDVNGTTLKEFFTADTDTFVIPDNLLLMGLRWRWLREKGLDYGELFNTYERQVKDAMGRDGGSPTLYMDNQRSELKPGIFVPNGTWTVP
jgi:hypothetical protein